GFLNAVEGLQFGVSRTVAHAILWDASPALYGHTVLVVGGVIALVTAARRGVAWTALFLAALGILVSGSLEAAVAWIALALAFLLLRPPGQRRPRLVEAVLLAAMIGLSAGLAPLLGWGRLGFTLNAGAGDPARVNLFAGTEVPYADAWDDRWVDVTTEPVALAGAPYTAYTVTKRGAPGWYRLQQLVRLEPGATYTLSGWIDATGPTHPGFQGWGTPLDRAAEGGDSAPPFVLIATWADDGWSASVQGPGRLEGARVLDADATWRRVAATFTYQGTDPLTWFVGFTPDARSEAGTTGRMAGLQLERSTTAGPYVPGPARTGLSFDYARAPLWSVALRMGAERPLVGWGPDAFADRYARTEPYAAQRTLVPDHPHNLVLWTWVERGALGLAGLALLLAALLGPAVRARDLGLLAVAGAALAVNLFDATLLSGAVLYPLAAGAGWRRGRAPHPLGGAPMDSPPVADATHAAPPDATDPTERTTAYDDAPRTLLVRLVLAATDLAIAAVGLAGASWVTAGVLPPLDGPLPWLLLLWPAFALREGLYPGYGLTDADQLQRQVRGWAFATGAYALLARLAGPDLLPASPLALVLLAVTT
ncbi:MAG: O-antigen ligase family protein, partial [Trueperaceae bacterium]|nr:O-antigen ligase family protein [Trueperaceae bacterium]